MQSLRGVGHFCASIKGTELGLQVGHLRCINAKKTEKSMPLGMKVRGFWISCPMDLFPWIEERLGPLSGRYRKFLLTLEMVEVENFLPRARDHMPSRMQKHRAALAEVFLAEMVFNGICNF